MKRIYAVFLLVTLLASGCQDMRQEVEPVNLNQIAKKLVVIGFISPQDTVLAIKVGITRPIADANYMTNYGTVTNAKVTLVAGNRSIQLRYNGNKDYYQADPKSFTIRAGEMYQLTALIPDGMQASGVCTVPQPARLQRVRLDSTENSSHLKQYFVRYYWQDVPAKINYYQTTGRFTYAKSPLSNKAEAGAKPRSETAPVLFESLGTLNTLLSDQTRDGKLLESNRGYLPQSTTVRSLSDKVNFVNLYDKATIKAVLLHVDEAYFNYHQALELQKKSEGNPFAEPVLLPSTITGGLGCFAGYNQSSLTMAFK